MKKREYKEKFETSIMQSNFDKLLEDQKVFIKEIAFKYFLTFQEIKQIVDISIDLNMWMQEPLSRVLSNSINSKKQLLKSIKDYWLKLKYSKKSYKNFTTSKDTSNKFKIESLEKDVGFGLCPVASIKTRCCNLLTLDAVESCGYDCSYCSIQSFYNEEKIVFNSTFKDKLANIKIDPNEIYHIGTGQSSDSLMWGDRYGVLTALVDFARKYPNVVLEMKTKSKNIDFFLNIDIPKNIIFTWSLNPQVIINHEESLTASLSERINAAKILAKRGLLVGFHFHPMIYFEDYKSQYGKIFDELLINFDSSEVALLSLGTLTFIKPVIKKIRSRDFKTKILQMPLVDSDGKYSYPREIKLEMFKFAYESLKLWHKDVFFYMCMENHDLWREVFGYDYPTNESFEIDMKLNYMKKIKMLNH